MPEAAATRPDAAKAALRKLFAAKRRALPSEMRAGLSRRIAARLTALPEWDKARSVMLYMPIQGEVDLSPLIEGLIARETAVLLPRCRPGEPGIMDARTISCREDLVPGSHGILEPDPAVCPACETLPDLIVVPGLAFDRNGCRLGFGGGYYDRLLSAAGPVPLAVGAAYAFQIVDALPAQSWDMRLAVLVSEDETIRLSP